MTDDQFGIGLWISGALVVISGIYSFIQEMKKADAAGKLEAEFLSSDFLHRELSKPLYIFRVLNSQRKDASYTYLLANSYEENIAGGINFIFDEPNDEYSTLSFPKGSIICEKGGPYKTAYEACEDKTITFLTKDLLLEAYKKTV